jgi:hypothetical protein
MREVKIMNHFLLAMAFFSGICFATTSFAGDWFSDDIISFVREPTTTGEWAPPDTLQELQAFFQLGAFDPKGAFAALMIGAQVTGTQPLKPNPRREISLDDQRGNDWWSGQPVIMTGTGAQPLKTTPGRGISLDDQRGNDWWSEQPVTMTGIVAQPLKTAPSRGISLDDQRGNDWWSEQPTSESPGTDQISFQIQPRK